MHVHLGAIDEPQLHRRQRPVEAADAQPGILRRQLRPGAAGNLVELVADIVVVRNFARSRN
jgi:hypothetical protein